MSGMYTKWCRVYTQNSVGYVWWCTKHYIAPYVASIGIAAHRIISRHIYLMHTCMHAHTCTCTYTWTCTYTHAHAHVNIRTHGRTQARRYTHTCSHTHTQTHTCTRRYIHTHTHIRKFTYIHIFTHAYVYTYIMYLVAYLRRHKTNLLTVNLVFILSKMLITTRRSTGYFLISYY